MAKRLSPEQRLAAFAEHCRLTEMIRRAGKEFRQQRNRRQRHPPEL